MKINWKLLIGSFLSVFAIAFLGSLTTDIGPRYDSIRPAITPPNYVFSIVWTILFILIALSMYFALLKKKTMKKMETMFAINLLLNFLWSFIFFGLKQVRLALMEIIFLWISTLSIIIFLWKVERKSAYLLIPYLIWITFAAYLNCLIAIANP